MPIREAICKKCGKPKEFTLKWGEVIPDSEKCECGGKLSVIMSCFAHTPMAWGRP